MLEKVLCIFILCVTLTTADSEAEEGPLAITKLVGFINDYVFGLIKHYLGSFVTFMNEMGEYFKNIWEKMDKLTNKLVAFTRDDDCHFMCPKGTLQICLT